MRQQNVRSVETFGLLKIIGLKARVARVGWVENPPILNNNLRWVLLPTLHELTYFSLIINFAKYPI